MSAARKHPAREKVDPFAALRESNYRRFAIGFICSSTGLQMLTTGVQWEIWERTHDALWLGYIGLARALPVLLLALPAGHAADIFSRRVIVALTQAGFAIAALGFLLASRFQAPVGVFMALLFASGCVRAFSGPSRGSLLPLLVPDDRLQSAITWNSGLFQCAAVSGPLIAGALISITHSVTTVYAAAAILTAVFAGAAIALRPRPAPRAKTPFTLSSMLAGMDHLIREKTIFGAITLDLLAVLFGGATALLPLFATDILHAGPVEFGMLRAATFVGAILVAVWLAGRSAFLRAGPVLLTCVAAFGVCMIGFGVSKSIWLSIVLLAASGAFDNISVVIRHLLVQTRTPNHLRGRVGAVNSVFIECSNELGALESGVVANFFGPVISVVSGGIGTLAVVGFVAMAFPALRRLGRIHEPKGQVVEELEVESTSTAR